MTYKFIIRGRLPALNEHIAAANNNRYDGNTLKKYTDMSIVAAIKKQIPRVQFERQVDVSFLWVEKNKKRDKDNICFAKKYILDALQKAGTLKGDGWACINSFSDSYDVDSANPRIEVTLREAV